MLERTVLLDGFSKTFAMTGWRLGYGLFPRRCSPCQPPGHQQRLLHFSFSQKAAVGGDYRPARRG